MNSKTKAIAAFLLIGSVVGIVTLSASNSNLFQGFIGQEERNQGDPESEIILIENTLSSDLEPKLEVSRPLEGNEDIIANATIENIGPGTIESGQTFTYTIYINGEESFSNTDSYVNMAPGDSFSFSYPIPRTIHGYENTGEVEFRLDVDEEIEEADESNNSIVVNYDFSDLETVENSEEIIEE